jgi:hypothetical protein
VGTPVEVDVGGIFVGIGVSVAGTVTSRGVGDAKLGGGVISSARLQAPSERVRKKTSKLKRNFM